MNNKTDMEGYLVSNLKINLKIIKNKWNKKYKIKIINKKK
jgi:hypothetical protein